MSYDNEYGSRDNEFRRNQESSDEYGSGRRGYGSNEFNSERRNFESSEYGSDRRGYGEGDDGIRTEAGRNAQGHFNSAAEGIGRAAAAFEQGGGRQEFESVGNPIANRNENEGERANPFLKPAQELAAATQEGLKGLPGAIFEFATGQYEAHKMHPEGNRFGHNQERERRDEY
ncbi:hypothetical protein RhiJN_10016 [Ceratobasidium sp. AG-Ba]|nr:hypothetical protein RhiJN_10016 [Ceratobasidium sp. AG-Ba]QRW10784.1 hypothetical protein RhiLY_09783 [Ceratobasidium sp. AG-Ba]